MCSLNNIVRVQDTLEGIRVPDIVAYQLLEESSRTHTNNFPRFSMAAGDFVEVYGTDEHREAFDAVVTCFFIDTAPNPLEYLQTIQHVLKPGGYWLNLGPLLYHWVADVENNCDARYDRSIELSYEELRYCIEGYGFHVLSEQQRECRYADQPKSMMHTVYQAIQFTVQKPMG